MQRAAYVFVFLLLTAEPSDMWGGLWKTPMGWSAALLLEGSILKVQGVDICVVLMLLLSPKPPSNALAVQMPRALWTSIAVGAFMVLVGLSRGGDLRQALFQLHALISAIMFAFALMRILRTPEDFIGLGRAVVYAALWRAGMCILFFVLMIREGRIYPVPETVTTHDDTVLWVAALIMLLVYALEMKTQAARRFAYLAVPVLLLAVHYNNRRLAWVSLTGALIALYFVFPASDMKADLNRKLRRFSPLLLAYLIVGKMAIDRGVNTPVFKPLASIFSSSDPNNPSTKSRDAENMGLLITFMPEMYLGTGLGHEYIEVDWTLSARNFLQYRYVPHNSVLGFVAFCGVLGFFGIWGVFPVSVLLNTRAHRMSADPRVRVASAVGVAEAVISMSQAYGDMGLFSIPTLYIMAGGWACAARLPVLAEAEIAKAAAQEHSLAVG